MIYQEWTPILLDYDRSATEFTGDDVDRFSALCALDKPYEKLLLYIPTLDSATVSIYIQMTDAISEVPLPLHLYRVEAAANAAWATTAGTGGIVILCECAAGIQFFRLYTGANQTANRTFYVLGSRS